MKIYYIDHPPCCMRKHSKESGMQVSFDLTTRTLSIPLHLESLPTCYELPFHNKMDPLLDISDGRRVLTHRIHATYDGKTTVFDLVITLKEEWFCDLANYAEGTEPYFAYDEDLRED